MKTGAINHIVLTVSDLDRSKAFYTSLLGFQVIGENLAVKRISLSNGELVMGIGLPFDASQTPANDQFSEHRMGLDHLSLSVDSHDDLLAAAALFDEHDVPHGEIKDLRKVGFPLFVMAFRDPDNIQLELSASAEM